MNNSDDFLTGMNYNTQNTITKHIEESEVKKRPEVGVTKTLIITCTLKKILS